MKLNDDGTGIMIVIDETNISWKYDRENFKNTPNPEKQWMDHTNGIFLKKFE